MRISRELEVTISLAINEARRRRHEFLCLEHVLHALLFDETVAEVVRQCGGDVKTLQNDLEEFLKENLESLPEEAGDIDPQQTLAFHRVLQRAASHVESASKEVVETRNFFVALFREDNSHSVYLLEKQGVTRLDVLNYISHGVSKIPSDEEPAPSSGQGEGSSDEEGEPRRAKDPLEAFTTNLVQKAKDGKVDPLIGREVELERTIHVLCRRRKNNPIYVGDSGVGKTAIADGRPIDGSDLHHQHIDHGLFAGPAIRRAAHGKPHTFPQPVVGRAAIANRLCRRFGHLIQKRLALFLDKYLAGDSA